MEVVWIFYLIVFILCLDFGVERGLEYLNFKSMSSDLPEVLKGIYSEQEYGRFVNYEREIGRLDLWSSCSAFVMMIVFLLVGGFGWFNGIVVAWTDSAIWQTILFVLGLSWVASWVDLPFEYYRTFTIEGKYGFNRMSGKTFWADVVKRMLLSLLIGSLLLALIVWFYMWGGPYFWIYAWGVVSCFSLLLSVFYSQLIVPLFNKQTLLEDGSLRNKIQNFAETVGFCLDNIYVIDGSKRSSKANAYFTGFGPRKRIVLYDTLLKELGEEEIVAVLAHEIGHYRKHHTLQAFGVSVLHTGFLLWLFSLFVNEASLSLALDGDKVYFQLGLVAFMILYTPISTLLGITMNVWSRKNEYQADAYATWNYDGDALISGLKKISIQALSNLTPHPWYEYVYYSHPSLLKRMDAIQKINLQKQNKS